MVRGTLRLSLWCARGDHDRCAHQESVGVGGLWRGRPRLVVALCGDSCHDRRRCPLVGRRKVARDQWRAECTCPGADQARRSLEQAQAQRRDMAAVLADVDRSDHPDVETVERRLSDALAAHDRQPPFALTSMARVLAAQGRPGRDRWAHWLRWGAGVAGRTVRWAWQLDTWTSGHGQRLSRRPGFFLSGLVGAAALLAAGAARAHGWRRVPWTGGALLTALAAAWFTTVGTVIRSQVQTAGNPSEPPQPSRQ